MTDGRRAVRYDAALACRELSEADLQSLGANRERPEQDEQRQWKRFETNITATVQQVTTAEQTPCAAKVLNVSVSGVGLLVDRVIENGALLSVELHNAAATIDRTLLACVVHVSRRAAGEWALGCNFIRSLGEDDLKALLESDATPDACRKLPGDNDVC